MGIYEVYLELVFKPAKLMKSKGLYVDYSSGDIGAGIWLREWCCTHYSLDDTISADVHQIDFVSKDEVEFLSAIFRTLNS